MDALLSTPHIAAVLPTDVPALVPEQLIEPSTSPRKRMFNEIEGGNGGETPEATPSPLKRARVPGDFDKESSDDESIDDEFSECYFDKEHPDYGSIIDVFSDYIIPYLSPRDSANVACQSRVLHDRVVKHGVICSIQITHALRTARLTAGVLPMLDRFLLQKGTTATDAFAIVVTAVLNNSDVDIATRVVSRIMETPVPRGTQARSAFKALARHAIHATPWLEISGLNNFAEPSVMWKVHALSGKTTALPIGNLEELVFFSRPTEGAWRDTKVFEDMANYPMPFFVKSVFETCLTDVQADSASATLINFSEHLCTVLSGHKSIVIGPPPLRRKTEVAPTAHTRISGALLKTLVSSGIVTAITWMVDNKDTLIAAIVRNIARLEGAGVKDIQPELEAIDFIVATCAFSNSNELPETACELASNKISANLLQKLQPNVGNWSLKNSSRSSPIRISILNNNVNALRWIARLAMAQNTSATTQKRAVELALSRKAFPCLRILVEEGFMLTSSLLKNTIIQNKEAWPDADREKAFDAIFTNIEVTAARTRTGLEPLVKYLIKALDLKFEASAITCEVWPACVAGGFLSAFWSSTDGRRSGVRAKIASTPDFRKLVDYTLVGHIQLFYGTLVRQRKNGGTSAPVDHEKYILTLLDRISELFDIQTRCTTAYQPSTEIPTPTPSATDTEANTFDPTGISFDMWLTTMVLPNIAIESWRSVKALASMIPEVSSCVVASVVHTDEFMRNIALRGSFKKPGSETLFREILQSSSDFDPDHKGGDRAPLMRRVMRWAGIFQESESLHEKINSEHVAVLESVASVAGNTGIFSISERLDHVISATHHWFALQESTPRIGGVQRLYTEYKGDVDIALVDLYTKLEDKRPTTEPTGEIREILIYAMASSERGGVTLDQKTVLETLVKYTSCITLPCVSDLHWVAVRPDFQKTAPTPWIRDALRGVRPHVRWWATW